jgi:FKBP-type peptidyl-prolyl cis-trans isomerase
LISGKEFDKGENITFPLNGVIPGWTEGLQLMKEGAKYRFFIPSSLAYGESGAARVIPPNSALVFEVDLVKVNR